MKIKITQLPIYAAVITLIMTFIVVWQFNVKVTNNHLLKQQSELESFHFSKDAEHISSLLEKGEIEEVKQVVSEISTSKFVKRVLVFTTDWRILASNKISEENKSLVDVDKLLFQKIEREFENSKWELSDGALIKEIEVYYPDSGWQSYFLFIQFNLSSLNATYIWQLYNNLILYTLCTVIIAVSFYLSLKKTMKRRLQRVQDTCLSYMNGDKSIRYSPKNNSDFIQLELILNAMFDLIEHEQELITEEKLFSKTILDSTTNGIISVNSKGEIVMVNRQAVSYFGYQNELDMVGKNVLCLIPEKYHIQHIEAFNHIEHDNLKVNGILNKIRDVKGLKKSGDQFPISITVATTTHQSQRYYSAFISDLTKTKKYEKSIEKLAYFDELTKLPNINFLNTQLTSRKSVQVMCLVELSEIRTFNDAYGYSFGDNYMKLFAQEVANLELQNLLVARGSGSRFIVVSTDNKTSVRNQVMGMSNKFVEINGIKVKFNLCASISELTPDASVAQTIRMCRRALRNALEKEVEQFVDVDINWIKKEQEKAKVHHQLSEAIDLHELYFEYQPKYSSETKDIRGAEALIRWTSNGKRIPPGVFIPIAESSNIMLAIDRFVIEEACRKLRDWLDAGLEPVPLAINLSSKYLFLDATISFIFEKLGSYNIPGELLEIEVTEYGLIKNFKETAKNMEKLQNAGVSVAIDDFGTGHSNLQSVSELPIQNLKIDQAFIREALKSDKSKAILENIVHLAKALNIKLTAEGVETERQFEFVRAVGCDYVQGYLLSEPLSQDAYEEKLSLRRV